MSELALLHVAASLTRVVMSLEKEDRKPRVAIKPVNDISLAVFCTCSSCDRH